MLFSVNSLFSNIGPKVDFRRLHMQDKNGNEFKVGDIVDVVTVPAVVTHIGVDGLVSLSMVQEDPLFPGAPYDPSDPNYLNRTTAQGQSFVINPKRIVRRAGKFVTEARDFSHLDDQAKEQAARVVVPEGMQPVMEPKPVVNTPAAVKPAEPIPTPPPAEHPYHPYNPTPVKHVKK
jgi:hypothetical protein